jgi:hypothetical protein
MLEGVMRDLEDAQEFGAKLSLLQEDFDQGMKIIFHGAPAF